MANVTAQKMLMEDNAMNANQDIGIFPIVNLVNAMAMILLVILKLESV